MAAVSKRVRAKDAPAGDLPPLRLGAGETPFLEADISSLERPHAVRLRIPGVGRVHLGRRAALALADWLYAWVRPRSEVELWGVAGIEKECEVSRKTVYNWADRDDFPRPVEGVGLSGPAWEARAVKAWLRVAKPKGGRPKKQRTRD